MSGWLTPFDRSGIEWHEALPSPYTYQESDFAKLVAAVHEYEARYVDLQTLADGFLSVYTAASVSDEEGLLQAVDPDEMRQLWHRVDEAAFDLREFLSRESNIQASPAR